MSLSKRTDFTRPFIIHSLQAEKIPAAFGFERAAGIFYIIRSVHNFKNGLNTLLIKSVYK